MEKQKLLKLFEAIKRDDVKSFSFVMQSNSDLNVCFGRFPLLSLFYLYESYKILDKYYKETNRNLRENIYQCSREMLIKL